MLLLHDHKMAKKYVHLVDTVHTNPESCVQHADLHSFTRYSYECIRNLPSPTFLYDYFGPQYSSPIANPAVKSTP